MADYSNLAVYKVNSFITSKLTEQGIIPASSFYQTELDGQEDPVVLPFMTPVQQTPEQTTMFDNIDVFVNLPFVNYTLSYRSHTDLTPMNYGQVTYMVYSSDVDKLLEIGNFVVDLCRREDYSAYDLNQYLISDDDNNFDFTSLTVLNAGGPMETESEGGRYSFMIVVGFDYIYNNTVATNSNSYTARQGMWS